MSRNTVFGLDQPCWTVIFWRKNFTFSVNIPSIQFPITFLHHIHFLKKCYINFFPSTSQKIQPNSIWKHYLFSWKRISESTKSSMSPEQEWISRDWVLCIGLTIRMKIEGTNYVLKHEFLFTVMIEEWYCILEEWHWMIAIRFSRKIF